MFEVEIFMYLTRVCFIMSDFFVRIFTSK